MELGIYPDGVVSYEPLRIYTGLLGQIGDILMFTATARRIKQLFPNGHLTFAVSQRYGEVGDLVAGLPYVDRVFKTELYFEKLTPPLFQPWERGWPVDFRGDDEVVEQRRHNLVFETRPRHRDARWWEHRHLVEELAHQIGVPGPLDRQTEVALPPGVQVPAGAVGKIVLHNDPTTDDAKSWPWEAAALLVQRLGASNVVVIGRPGPELPGTVDLRGRTTLAETAALIGACRCYIGVDSGPMWIAASLQVPVVGLYGTSYIRAYAALQPHNLRAAYLQAEGPLSRIPVEAVVGWVEHVLEATQRGLRPAAGQRF